MAPDGGAVSRSGLIRVVVALGLVVAGSIYGLKRGNYYKLDVQKLAAADVVKQHTQPDDLVLNLMKGRSTGFTDPRFLYNAERRGWAYPLESIEHDDLNLLIEHGADVVALLLTPDYPPSPGTFPAVGWLLL